MSATLPNSSAPGASGEAQRLAIPDGMNRSRSVRHVRLLLRIDGVFEALLGALLALSPITGLYTALALPNPASKPVVLAFGLLLLPLLPVLWLISRAPRRELVLVLASANGAGALIFALWVLLWRGEALLAA